MSFHAVEKNGVRLLLSDALERAGARHAFTTRIGGVSGGDYASLNLRVSCEDSRENVEKNYQILADAVGFDVKNIVMSRQVHGDLIRRADAGEGLFRPDRPDADAVISDADGLALMAFVADCVPVLLCDRTGGAVAAVHAGWRGTALDIAGQAVARLCSEYGARAENIAAAIGPHICADCFETGGEVADAMAARYGEDIWRFIERRGEKFHPDLGRINEFALLRAGVRAENIDLCELCTKENEALFWSHRRTGDRRGVMGAAIVAGKAAR